MAMNWLNVSRSIYQTLSLVKFRRGVVYFLSVTGLIACKAAYLYETSSCPLTLPSTFDKLL